MGSASAALKKRKSYENGISKLQQFFWKIIKDDIISFNFVSVKSGPEGGMEIDFGKNVIATDILTGEMKTGAKNIWNYEKGQTRLFVLSDNEQN